MALSPASIVPEFVIVVLVDPNLLIALVPKAVIVPSLVKVTFAV